MSRLQRVHRKSAALSCLVAAAVFSAAAPTQTHAGTYIFASEGNGVNIITHPEDYTGTGGVVDISVCIDPASTNAALMVGPVLNAVAEWNALSGTSPNLELGAANNLSPSQIDFESVLLHELGHCIGLAHVNHASESGLPGARADGTKSTNGVNNVFNQVAGGDGLHGSADDVRSDDVNLHWSNAANDPCTAVTPGIVDGTTMSRTLLPAGDLYEANGDRSVCAALGASSTEAVMQQGTFFDEAQRQLGGDDERTIRLAMSGVDETQGTSDDYTIMLSYVGMTTACDIPVNMSFSNPGLAFCSTGGFLIGPNHVRLSNPGAFFGAGFNWFFNPANAVCGDGTTDTGEDCDDSGESATCDADCTFAICGDGTTNTTAGESCDDGGESATCDADCTAATCGDGNLNVTAGESCDDGDTAPGDGCNAICQVEVCGNGVVDVGEQCDDSGESASCDADCTFVVCGDGTTNASAGEECDDSGESAGCDADCSFAVCGDETLNGTSGEGCDDGNTTGGDGCSATCQVEVCGNGVVDVGEQCDDSGESAACDADCTFATCGDGTANASAGEQCDDSGESASCDADCTFVVCGDETLNGTSGEGCDDGNTTGGDGCSATCQVEECGNGVVDVGEQCDDSGESAACDADCTFATCGDGTTNASAGEECDDSGESAACDADCTFAACGDGTTNASAGETCDDSGESATCDVDCTAATCGDGTLNVSAGEGCDDANTTDGDGCSATCQVESAVDNDGDGVPVPLDCDDDDPDSHPACTPADNPFCDPPVPAAPELCDGKDNDCDGSLDEDFGVGDSCTSDGGAGGLCAGTGTIECVSLTAAECDAAPLLATTVCRPVAGDCDVEESCDGVSNTCPVDEFEPSPTECRPAAGVCDSAESCTGASAACPPDVLSPSTTECRSAAGACDVAESCSGADAACPADGFATATTECRASTDACDTAESCTGASAECPADMMAPATTVCRPAAGDCDAAESCDGVVATCPADGFAVATTVCRAAAGDCDVSESCTGDTADCPADAFEMSGAACDDGMFCTEIDECDGSGACTGPARDCGDSNGCTEDTCDDVADLCSNEPFCDVSGRTLYNMIVSGPADSPDPLNPIDDVSITLTGDATDSTSTANDGTYSFMGEAGVITVTPSRAASEDDIANALSATDAADISKASIGLLTFTPKQFVAGDVSGSGSLSAFDAALVAQRAVSIISAFDEPLSTLGGASWFFAPVSSTEDVTTGSEVTDVDFSGVIYGDVTMNWTGPTTLRQLPGPPVDPAVADLHERWSNLDPDQLRRQTRDASPGATIFLSRGLRLQDDGSYEIGLGLSQSAGILGLDLSLRYDPNSVSIESLATSRLAQSFQLDARELEGGAHAISLFSPAPMQGTGEFLVVRLKIHGPLTGMPFEVEARANEGAIPVVWVDDRPGDGRRGVAKPRDPEDGSAVELEQN